jgi:predicted ATPase
MRRGAELLREQNTLIFDGLLMIPLAETESQAGDVDRALAILDEALATSERIGHRTFEAELHRVRGEMLLKRDRADPAPAEEALQAAIGVAKQQGARNFQLRAALSLARIYQSTGRPVEAHTALAPALEGFSPTPEMPEIAEAQALMERLALGPLGGPRFGAGLEQLISPDAVPRLDRRDARKPFSSGGGFSRRPGRHGLRFGR